MVPVIFMASGILTAGEAWTGFSNTGVLIFVPLFVLGAILRKSSFNYHMKNFARKLGKTRGGELKIFAIFGVIAVLLANFMNATACVTLTIPLIAAACKDSELDRRSLNKFSSDIASTCRGILPLGMTLSSYLTSNAILEAGGATERFSMFDTMIMKTPVCLAWVAILIVFGRRFYKVSYKGSDPYVLEEATDDSGKEIPTTLSPAKDRLAYILFFGGMALMVVGTMTTSVPLLIWAFIPAIIGVYAKVVSFDEAVKSMIWDTILLSACTMPLTTAITKTGADVYISNAAKFMLFGNTSLPVVAAVFFLLPLICTQFMSDTATGSIFRSLGVATAVSFGIDPRVIMMATAMGSGASMATPMGSGQSALSFGTGGYTMGEYLKSSLFSVGLYFVLFMAWMPIASRLFG